MSIFGLTAADLRNKITPVAGQQVFSIGVDGDMTEARALEVIAVAEDQALMRVPQRYRALIRSCDGEVLVANARGGETTLKCQLYPVTSGTLKLFLNFPVSTQWTQRNDADAMSDASFTLTPSTGVVTLASPLVQGDRVWCSYDHTAATRLLGIRDIVLSLAAVEVARQFSYFRSAEGFDRFERWESSAYQSLNNMIGLDLLDRVPLVNETEDSPYSSILRM